MKLKSYRKKYGETQGMFGARCGLSKSYISQLEAGKRSPPLDTLWKIHIATEGEVRWFDWLDLFEDELIEAGLI